MRGQVERLQSQSGTPASGPTLQTAAQQVPIDDPYRTPSASPASMRPKRELAVKGRPTPERPDAAVKMPPPPPAKRKPSQQTLGQKQYQAAVVQHSARTTRPLGGTAGRKSRNHCAESDHIEKKNMPGWKLKLFTFRV